MLSSEEPIPPRRRRTPSFSSSLLDAIYRSIDDSKSDHHHHHHHNHRHHHKKHSKNSSFCDKDFNFNNHRESNDLRRAMMIESWVEKQSVALSNSASSSSESIWSSSEHSTDSKLFNSKPRATNSASAAAVVKSAKQSSGGFSKTKLRALKLYGELKKVKQPISPGGRISSFLNSIFGSSAAANAKKAKMCYVGAAEDVASPSEIISNYNAAKSCLSRKARAKGQGEEKRSVRFYPVSVVLGENADGHPDHHDHRDRRDKADPCLMALSSSVRRSFEKKSSGVVVMRRFCGDDHDETDDDLSCSSSDLFELDHLVGVGRYREELPVYETTSLKTNQAIANGLIL